MTDYERENINDDYTSATINFIHWYKEIYIKFNTIKKLILML